MSTRFRKYLYTMVFLARKHFVYIALAIALLLVTSGSLMLYLSSQEQFFLEKKWVYVSFHGDQPIDIAIGGDYVYVVGINVRETGRNKTSSIAVYKFSLENGELLWRIVWRPREGGFLYPLGIHVIGENVVIPFLYENRHNVGVLCYSQEGRPRWVRQYNFSSITWVYDVVPFYDGSLYVAGTRYRIGRKLEFYIAKINETGGLEWVFINGTTGDDIVTSIKISRDGIIYAWGKSQGNGVVFAIDTSGTLQWIQVLGKNTVRDVYVDKTNLYILVRQNNSYILVVLDRFTGTLSSTNTIVAEDTRQELNAIALLDNRILYAGKTIKVEESRALVTVSSKNTPGRIENTILITITGEEDIRKIIVYKDNVVVLGSTSGRLFIYCFIPKH